MFAANTTQVASSDAVFVENIFSTFLYTGNGSTQTITNNIDLSTKGGLVWIKRRNAVSNNRIYDTARGMVTGVGGSPYLYTNTDNGNLGTGFDASVTSSTTGFNIAQGGIGDISDSGGTYASWTFREQAKFFDIVTWTGDGTNGRTISHNLGATPGFVLIKQTSSAEHWWAWHRSTSPSFGLLEGTDAFGTNIAGVPNYNIFGNGSSFVAPSSTALTVASSKSNTNGQTFVAYLFAHNAGGFGLTGTDNVISCGSYTGNGTTGQSINLGYEPQWLLIKSATATYDWVLYDNMRGMPVNGLPAYLRPNTANAEQADSTGLNLTSTGFALTNDTGWTNASGGTYIYIAIRRGPMKVPTSGTSVFSPVTSSSADGTQLTSGFPIDMQMLRTRALTNPTYVVDRLRGVGTTTTAISNPQLRTNLTNAEASTTGVAVNWNNTGFAMPTGFGGVSEIFWNFRRAPSFFDEVCYTGNGVNARAITHNLGVAPEMIIVKKRTGADGWVVWASGLTSRLYELYLNDPRAQFVEASPRLNVNNAPTSTQFEVGTDGEVNASGATYVSYLFASCPGVSKVGSYTGTGATQTISCGLVARFVLIKRTDSTGNWFVWDTARGMVAGTDPRLALNSTAAESNANWVYTDASGFQIVTTDASVNASGGTYIYLAIA